MKKNNSIMVASSGNVFKDLGLEDSQELTTKSGLVFHISNLLKKRKLTQVEAASILGIDQPKVSQLLCGKLDGFSTERIFRFLMALDQDIEISIKTKKGRSKGGRIKVLVSV